VYTDSRKSGITKSGINVSLCVTITVTTRVSPEIPSSAHTPLGCRVYSGSAFQVFSGFRAIPVFPDTVKRRDFRVFRGSKKRDQGMFI
jgi:hypothetical protein